MNSSTFKSFEKFPITSYNYKLIFFMPSEHKKFFYSFILPFSFFADICLLIPRKIKNWFSSPKVKYKIV